jgi:crossover junction endodeoxyribonuclease RuvC
MNILAIDPGKGGGWAFFEKCVGIKVGKMPLVGDLIDVSQFLNTWPINVVYIELVHAMKGQGVTSMFTFGKGYGQLIGFCQTLKLRYVLVTPQAWKKEVLVGTNKDKDAALEYCSRTYPNINLIPERCRTPHDGIADALCILTYAINKEKPLHC